MAGSESVRGAQACGVAGSDGLRDGEAPSVVGSESLRDGEACAWCDGLSQLACWKVLHMV